MKEFFTTKGTKFGVLIIRTLRVLRAFVVSPSESICSADGSALLLRHSRFDTLRQRRYRINYLLLATALLGTFFSGTATRIVSISMPTVAQSLGTDLLGVSWAFFSYQLSNIGLSVIFGRISDIWGREKLFALGFLVFAISSLLCGFSQSVLQLIGARFIQGIGGAMLR